MPVNRIPAVLVHVDGAASNVSRLAVACDVAQRHGSALAALFAAAPPLLDVPYAHVGGAIALDGLQELFRQRLGSARRMALRACAQRALEGTWQELSGVTPAIGFAQQALYADLLVLGQHDASDASAQHVPADFAHSVLLRSGKPALIVPSAGVHEGIGRNAVVAWKATRESARALSAALPLLREAAQVHVFIWGEDGAVRAGRTPDVVRCTTQRACRANSARRCCRAPRSWARTCWSWAATATAGRANSSSAGSAGRCSPR